MLIKVPPKESAQNKKQEGSDSKFVQELIGLPEAFLVGKLVVLQSRQNKEKNNKGKV